MDALRRWIVDDFEKGAGRHDDPDIYGGPPGDPGLIGPGSMSREINADVASVSQRHPPRRRAVPRAGSGTDRMGAHLHPVDDFA